LRHFTRDGSSPTYGGINQKSIHEEYTLDWLQSKSISWYICIDFTVYLLCFSMLFILSVLIVTLVQLSLVL